MQLRRTRTRLFKKRVEVGSYMQEDVRRRKGKLAGWLMMTLLDRSRPRERNYGR
jgi:hypothetical protein